MIKAYELGMTNGEYVFYTIEMLPEENVLNPEDVWASNDGKNMIAKKAFEAVFHVRLGLYKHCFARLYAFAWCFVGKRAEGVKGQLQ